MTVTAHITATGPGKCLVAQVEQGGRRGDDLLLPRRIFSVTQAMDIVRNILERLDPNINITWEVDTAGQ